MLRHFLSKEDLQKTNKQANKNKTKQTNKQQQQQQTRQSNTKGGVIYSGS